MACLRAGLPTWTSDTLGSKQAAYHLLVLIVKIEYAGCA